MLCNFFHFHYRFLLILFQYYHFQEIFIHKLHFIFILSLVLYFIYSDCFSLFQATDFFSRARDAQKTVFPPFAYLRSVLDR